MAGPDIGAKNSVAFMAIGGSLMASGAALMATVGVPGMGLMGAGITFMIIGISSANRGQARRAQAAFRRGEVALMSKPVKAGVPIIGVIFLALALIKFLGGDSWVVWAILGFLFGGFGIFSMNSSKGGNGHG